MPDMRQIPTVVRASCRRFGDLIATFSDSQPLVPSLADVPDEALARVFVFTNGVAPEGPRGPLGFQRDVFGAVPGDEAYRPLRAVQLVTWADDATPRELGSVDEIRDATTAGQVTVGVPGIVVTCRSSPGPAAPGDVSVVTNPPDAALVDHPRRPRSVHDDQPAHQERAPVGQVVGLHRSAHLTSLMVRIMATARSIWASRWLMNRSVLRRS
jgi:hypothetical protein